MWWVRFRALLVCMLVATFVQLTYGQLIDGAANPDQIPDVVALRLFLGAIAEPPTAARTTPGDAPLTPSPRQAGKLEPVGLAPADTTALLRSVGTWQKQTGTRTGSVDLDAVTQSTVNMLRTQMSAQGFAALMTYVRSQKKYMKRVQVQN